MAVEQSVVAGGVASVTVGLAQLAPPIAFGDFGWMFAAALVGIAFKHAGAASDERIKAASEMRAQGKPVVKSELPTIDWTALFYDAFSAPALAILGWVGAALVVKWLWGVDLDPRGCFVAAMCSGFIGAEWVRWAYTSIKGVINRKVGG